MRRSPAVLSPASSACSLLSPPSLRPPSPAPVRSIEELNALKEEIEALNKRLAELTEEELKQVAGGFADAGFKRLFMCQRTRVGI